MNSKRMFLIIVYAVIFIFSIFSIIQMRYFISKEKAEDSSAKFVIFSVETREMSWNQFILLKLSLFAFIGIGSFILMLTNYFYYSNPHLEDLLISEMDKDIKKLKEDEKKA